MNSKKIIFSLLFLISFLILNGQSSYCIISQDTLPERSASLIFSSNKITTGMNLYTEHPRIEIINESDFQSLGFSGDGKAATPYSIAYLNITQTDQLSCISIRDVHAYITIEANIFDGSTNSQVVVYLENVTNVYLAQNQVLDGTKGIYIQKSRNCEIFRNSLSGFKDGGIVLDNCSDNTIEGNIIENTSLGAIKVLSSPNHNLIAENKVSGDIYDPGIYVAASNVTIRDNTVIGCNQGIFLSNTNDSTVTNNFVNTSSMGIQIRGSKNTISQNKVELSGYTSIEVMGNENEIDNNQFLYGKYGIVFRGNSNAFTENTIYNCTVLGIEVQNPSGNNLIKWNDFIWNGLSYDSQAYVQEGSSTNSFTANYWDDFTYPDDDADGTVDNPYLIPVGYQPTSGPDNITDDAPLTVAYNSLSQNQHYFDRPRIISFPTSQLVTNEVTLTKTVRIRWSPVMHLTTAHTIYYSLFYSAYVSGQDVWVAIVENITADYYDWDTRDLQSSGGMCCFSLKVIGVCSCGYSIEYIAANFYGVTNVPASWDLPVFLITLCGIAIVIRKKRC